MGSFEGHIIPGTIFSLMALWWGFHNSLKYIRAARSNSRNGTKRNFNNKLTFRGSTVQPLFFLPTRKLRLFPFESFFKLIGLIGYISIEIFMGMKHQREENEHKFGPNNLHHATMIGGFLLASIVEIMVHYGVKLPKRIEYIYNGLAVFVQALVMTIHLHKDKGIYNFINYFIID